VIALIDYGAGNLRSVEKALRYLGTDVKLVQQPSQATGAQAMVLPGVGAFDDCIQALDQQGLLPIIKGFIQSGRPFLGICVGYQALFERSEEFNSQAPGLCIFPGHVVRFPALPGLKVPQIGWNQVVFTQPSCPLFEGVPDRSYFYFVHSYFPKPEHAGIVAGQTEYGLTFASAIWNGNVFATQFHPEKSQGVGLQLLENFLKIADAKPAGPQKAGGRLVSSP
jgi:glutamine amidotransferase